MSEQPFEVQLELFDGPIDLLLHLVKKRELPIEKVSLAEVTSQYLECISRISELDFDLAGEYLVIAATLVSLKSSVLLGEPKVEFVDEEKGPDPHEELLRRLREAAIYCEGAGLLATRPLLGVDVFPAQPAKGSLVSAVVLRDHEPLLLGKALRKLLDRVGAHQKQEIVIKVDPVSIADHMVRIVDSLKLKAGGCLFEELFDRGNEGGVIGAAGLGGAGAAGNREDAQLDSAKGGSNLATPKLTVSSIVATFLALLELAKRSMLVISQDNWCDSIRLSLVSDIDTKELYFKDVEFDKEEVADTVAIGEDGAPMVGNM